MTKPTIKIQKKLDARLRGHKEILDRNKNNTTFKPEAYKKPGSRNLKK